MGGSGAPQVTIPLRDGAELTVAPEGLRLGERHFPLESIQDARQVSPDPETVALRIAGAGMLEFQPARPGEGAVALEALFRLRPELRPAGFEPAQGLPPTFPAPAYAPPYSATGFPPFGAPYPPPPAPYGAPPYAPPGYPPAGYAPAPPMPAPYGYSYRASPNTGRSELTPYPRNFGELLGQIFQLYFKYWGKWLTLGLCVALLPAVASGAAQVALYLMLGVDPFNGPLPTTTISVNSDGTITSPFTLASGNQLLIYAGALAGALVLSALLGAWQTAALTIGGREALLGQGVPVGRALSGGLRRYVPTLVASVVVSILKLLVLAPALACFALALASLATDTSSGANLQAAQTGGALSCVALALLIPGVILWALFTVRLGPAPYAAAAERIGPFAAMRKSWQITRGQFWRVFGIIIVVGFVVAVVANMAGLIGVASLAVALLVAAPLVSVVTTPLTALAYTTLLYDLRLRREGYSAVVAGTAAQAEKTPTATTT